jgi:putative acetyltransferase
MHPAVAGQGAGRMLYDAVEKLSASRGAPHLAVDASDTAREFFSHRGFTAEQRNSVSVGNEWLSNTTMKKQLAAKERAS